MSSSIIQLYNQAKDKALKQQQERQAVKKDLQQRRAEISYNRNAAYGDYEPLEESYKHNLVSTDENDQQYFTKSVNKWANPLVQDKSFNFNPKLNDPKYLAMIAAKRGLKSYYEDVDGDGIKDAYMVDAEGKLKSFKGYSIGKGEQLALKQKYYDEVEYDPDTKSYAQSFTSFKQGISDEDLKKINSQRMAKGLGKIKIAPASVSEQVKKLVSKFYKDLKTTLHNNYAMPEEVIKARYNPLTFINTLSSRIIGIICLYGRYNKNGVYNNGTDENGIDTDEKKIIQKILKCKGPNCEAFRNSIVDLANRYVSETLYNEQTIELFAGNNTYYEIIDKLLKQLQNVINNSDDILNTFYQRVEECIHELKFKAPSTRKAQLPEYTGGRRVKQSMEQEE